MDFSQALTYPFSDPDGIKKLAIAVGVGLLFFIPIIGWIAGGLLLAGWSYETAKAVKRGDPTPLAAWDDFGGLMNRGLQIGVPFLVYQLPSFLFVCAISTAVILPFLGLADEDLAGVLFSSGLGVFGCCSCLLFFYSLAAGIIYWGGYIRYMDNEQMGTFFQFGENIALVRNNIGDFGMALVFTIIGNFIVVLLSGTGIGGLVAPAFQNYFQAHILGQLARKLSIGGLTPVPQV
jgi:hypothetical protein